MNAESRRKPVEQFLILGMTPRTLGVAALTMIGTAATAITLILSAVHNAAEQVRQIRDEFARNPPVTQDDLDRTQAQITDTTRQIKSDLTSGLEKIDVRPQVVVTEPPKPPRAPRPTPVATPDPTLAPTPMPTPRSTPRLLPPLPPLLP